ncbi:MAG: hypothetical protein DHS80DRAFT_24810 [Piptocephalis tieghemiana]|nr:MAG: hypothetical protein DHS80DRAFT_24810 [Piptocephalis tieghemiana]
MSSSTSSPHRQDALLRLTRPDFDTLVHRFLQRHRALSLPTEKWIWRKEEGLLELQGHLQPLPPSNSRETEEEEEDGWIPEVEPEEDDPSEWTNPPPIQSQDQQQDPLFPRAWSSWTYLIHWSPIWQVPVLYISAQHLDGQPLSLEIIYAIMRTSATHSRGLSPSRLDQGTLLQTAITPQPLPGSGLPGWMVHPCETITLLSHLASSSSSSSSSSFASPLGLDPSIYLAVWLGIYGGPFGLRIDPRLAIPSCSSSK